MAKQRGNISILNLCCMSSIYPYILAAKVRKKKITEEVSLFENDILGNKVNQVKLEEQLLVNFEKLMTATNNFMRPIS